jgi:hypothetical protein
VRDSTHALLDELAALERSLRELLALVDAPFARDEALSRALSRCVELTPQDAALEKRCRAVPESEREAVTVALRRVVDLNAIVRNAITRALATTALLIDCTRTARANLDALSTGTSGATVDCVT